MPVPVQSLMRESQTFVRWHVRLPADTVYDDLFKSATWAAVAESIGPSDLIRCQRIDGAFDVELVVTARVAGGLRLERFPKEPT
jgi:hypothetical protein